MLDDSIAIAKVKAARDPTHAYVYTYNQTGRLASATLNGATAGTYLVNGMEQRVVKTVGSTTTHFIFDRLGHLLAEANGTTGATQKEYIWLDDLPVAMVDDTGASPVITYIHTDHLGTPQKLTDGSMNLVWDGVFDPFGNPSSIAGSATMNLRFPGQYFDAETGLAQNWNRDYDPTLGATSKATRLGCWVASTPMHMSTAIRCGVATGTAKACLAASWVEPSAD
jgi:uncharacterized protein RhaS with RHS repeats